MATKSSRNGSDGIGANRDGSDGDGGQSERDGRWRRRPVGTGWAMATETSRNGMGDGDGDQSERDGRWRRRPIETGRAMAS
jgi:hypothetical protein